jgi:hypothetical protein
LHTGLDYREKIQPATQEAQGLPASIWHLQQVVRFYA